MLDWPAMKTEYITTGITCRELALKYGCAGMSVRRRAAQEKWTELRRQYQDKTVTSAMKQISDRQAQQIASLTGTLMEKLEQAAQELDLHAVRHVKKVREIEYGDDECPDKPTKETVCQKERLVKEKSVIDRRGLKQLTSALRDLKEVQMLKSDADRREQEARIAKLEKQSEGTEQGAAVEIVFSDDAEAFSQ